MSAQVKYEQQVIEQPVKSSLRLVETGENFSLRPGMPFAAYYQALYMPEPTPQQLALEEFLLECD
jgi:hypothetical protein